MHITKKTHNSYPFRNKQCSHILKFGQFGIKVISFERLTVNQINSIERLILQIVKKTTNNKKIIKIWKLITLNLQLTKLSSESRMGKGKGSIYTKAVFLRPGTIIFEFNGISFQQMLEIFYFISKKISFKISLVKKFG